MKIDKLLSRLSKVKRSGENKYMACCPAHNDRTASLTIREESDGRVLLSCFAGCDTYAILQTVGLDWDDLFPDKAIGHAIKKIDQIIYPSDALKIIQHEARIIMLAAYDIRKNKPLSVEDYERLEQAMQTINKALQGANV